MGSSGEPKLTIGLIVDDTIDKPDGVQQYVQVVGRWLSSQGHDVHYITGESYRSDMAQVHSMAKNLHVRFNGNKLSIPLWAPRRRINQLFNEVEFDILHVMTPHSPMLAQRVIMAAPSNVAVVGTFHILPHSWLAAKLTTILGWWLRPSLKRLDALLSVSTAAQTFVRQSFSMASDVLPNAIQTRMFIGAKPLPEYEGVPTIVFVNRLVERKGCIYLLKAVHYMRSQKLFTGPIKVVVCGRGALQPQLERYVQQNDLSEVVEFAGYISEEIKPRYIASADLAVYPSTGGESFGIVLVEAMAAARGVVIAGDNPGYRTVIEPHESQLIDPTNTAKFAELIASYLRDPGKRQAAHEWQQQDVGRYNIELVGLSLVKVYQAALRKRRDMR